MRIRLLILTVVTVLTMTTPALAQTTGSIVGCLTNVLNEGLPRATVSASAPDLRRTTLTNERGCYEFLDLPADAYRVTARLQGYDNVTRDRVQVSPQTAEAVEVFKRHATGGPTEKTIRFLQSQASGAPEPYHLGQELVLFLFWRPEENIFSDGGFPDTVRVVSVQAGRIMDAPAQLKNYVGAPIGGLLADLRKLTPR